MTSSLSNSIRLEIFVNWSRLNSTAIGDELLTEAADCVIFLAVEFLGLVYGAELNLAGVKADVSSWSILSFSKKVSLSQMFLSVSK